MLRFLSSQLRHRRGRSLTLALGIVVAAVAFVLLAGSTRTSALQIKSTLKTNYRSAYDILVRPKGSFTPLEKQQGLVRPNFLSGIYGGISFAQYREIEKIPGVQVAAPIANVGYTMVRAIVHVPLDSYLDSSPQQVYRIDFSWTSDNGLTHVPATSSFLYYAKRAPTGGQDRQFHICGAYGESIPPIKSPFDLDVGSELRCAWNSVERPSGPPVVDYQFLFPVSLAAIDPTQEAKLLHLDRALVTGRYLQNSEGVDTSTFPTVPAIAADRTFVRDSLTATIRRLAVPDGTNLQAMLEAGACKVFVYPCQPVAVIKPPPGAKAKDAYQFLQRLPGKSVGSRTYLAQAFYKRGLSQNEEVVNTYWTTSPTRYRQLGPDHLRPQPVPVDPDALADPFLIIPFGGGNHYYTAPRENEDLQFRQLRTVTGINSAVSATGRVPEVSVDIVGRYDPGRLPGFSPLSRVPLETYYPPLLAAADATSRSALGGKTFGPSQNLGGYIQQPPLMLTTLKALRAFQNPKYYKDVPPRIKRAPLSVIRVRVAGVTGTDALSRLRIRTVALKIHQRTGLDVDVTAGSSPHPLTITLPPGKFGRPKLLLTEGWSKKGATISYLNALDRKDLALYALVLVVCAVFLVNGALAVVRARRSEIGTLLTLGWSRPSIFGAVLGELAVVGALAGAGGVAIAALLVRLFGLAMPLTRTLYVLPIAVVLALVAGVVPAWQAARGEPLDALRPPVRTARRTSAVRTIPGLALINLTRLPVRTALGAAGLMLGVAALTILVAIERSFQGDLVGTVLGSAISLQVHGADFAAVGLTIALAAVSAADVLYLNLRERAPEFVTLSTLGWTNGQISAVVLLEAAALALTASVSGALIGTALGAALLSVPVNSLLVASVGAGLTAMAAAVAASAIPARQLLRLPAATVLAAE